MTQPDDDQATSTKTADGKRRLDVLNTDDGRSDSVDNDDELSSPALTTKNDGRVSTDDTPALTQLTAAKRLSTSER